jgi:Ca-activated chloride channel family protein
MRRCFIGIICLVAFSMLVQAGQNLRVDVRLVNVYATVTDSRGHYVGGLTKEDFNLEEDGVPQQIAHFSQDQQVPVSVGILFDSSGSMINKLRTAVNAVDRFIRTIHQDDDIFLMTFATRTDLREDFTNNRDKLSKALRTIQANGGTSLYDALEESLTKIKSGQHDKRAILLISDGEDTSSRTKLPEVQQRLRQSELLVYPLGISPPTYSEKTEHVPFNWPPPIPGAPKTPPSSRRDTVDMKVLQSLADDSGGRAFLLADSVLGGGKTIEKVLTEVAEELRSQYTLAFYPTHPDDNRFHTLKVKTRPDLTVRARPGYSATVPSAPPGNR